MINCVVSLECEHIMYQGCIIRSLEENKVVYYAIREIAFNKKSVRDYFAISTSKEHSKMIRAAFEEMWNGTWGVMCKEPEWVKNRK